MNSTIEQQAVNWFNKLNSGDYSEADVDRFKQWLVTDKQHQQAYRQVETQWRKVSYCDPLQVKPKAQTETAKRPPIKQLMAIGFTLVIGLLSSFYWFQDSPQAPADTSPSIAQQQYFTARGEVKVFSLPDGSQVWLGGDSLLTWQQDEKNRTATLSRGDAMFDVAHNPHKPFTVSVQDSQITVLGTIFDVQQLATGFKLTVAEGKVRASSKQQHKLLTANQQTRYQRQTFTPVSQLNNIDNFADWRKKRFHLQNAKFGDLISTLNRYLQSSVVLHDEALAQQTLSVAFNIDQLEQLLDSLQSAYGFSWSRDQFGYIHIRAKNVN